MGIMPVFDSTGNGVKCRPGSPWRDLSSQCRKGEAASDTNDGEGLVEESGGQKARDARGHQALRCVHSSPAARILGPAANARPPTFAVRDDLQTVSPCDLLDHESNLWSCPLAGLWRRSSGCLRGRRHPDADPRGAGLDSRVCLRLAVRGRVPVGVSLSVGNASDGKSLYARWSEWGFTTLCFEC